MLRSYHLGGLAFAALFFITVGTAEGQAAPIEISFSAVFSTGAVDTIGVFGPPGADLAGAALAGTLAYDPFGPLTEARRAAGQYQYFVNSDGGLNAHSLWRGGVNTKGHDFHVNSNYSIGGIFLYDYYGPADMNGLSYREMVMDVNGDTFDPYLAIEFHLLSLADFSGEQNLLATQEGMDRFFGGLISGNVVISVDAQSQTLPFGNTTVTEVPAPSVLAMFGGSLIGLYAIRRRRSSIG